MDMDMLEDKEACLRTLMLGFWWSIDPMNPSAVGRRSSQSRQTWNKIGWAIRSWGIPRLIGRRKTQSSTCLYILFFAGVYMHYQFACFFL